MARQKTKTEAAKNYKEFDITGSHNNDFKGRVYTEPTICVKGALYGISIDINDLTIKGCKLWVPNDDSKDCSILFPSYKDSKGDYQDFVVAYNKELREDLTDLANKINGML